MSDILKFRVWYKPNECYIDINDVDMFYLEPNGRLTIGVYDGDVDDMRYLREEDVIVERCTGLKDKHGKLIYEGDIVLNSFGVGPRYIYFYVSPNSSNVIQYILSKDTANPLNGALHNLWNGKDLEVVGNIHEHSISDLDKTYGQSDLVRQTINKIETSCKKYNWRTFED